MYSNTDRPQQSMPSYGRDTFRGERTSACTMLIKYHCNIIVRKAKTISKLELISFLDKCQREIKLSSSESHLTSFNYILVTLVLIRPSTLVEVTRHNFFSLLRRPLMSTIDQWFQNCKLDGKQGLFFRNVTKFLKFLFKNTETFDFNPSWLFASSLISMIATHTADLVKSKKYFSDKNKRELKSFTRLFGIYVDYQERINKEKSFPKDILFQFVGPIVRCLCSNHYIDSFEMEETSKNMMTTKERFFLIQCPSFIISYNSSRIEQMITSLLTAMVSQYVTLLNKTIPFIFQWNQSMFDAINHLLKLANHESVNVKVFIDHLPFVNHILTLIDTSMLYNNMVELLSTEETTLINTAISFLLKVTSEPTILAHIKQQKTTSILLRLTSTQHESLRFNTYMLLAHTATEEDIKAMPKPGILVTAVYRSLKTLIREKPDDRKQMRQTLETLKNLVQHDQLKKSWIKRNGVPILVACTKKCTEGVLTTLFEILWALSFLPDAANVLRADTEFIDKIQMISQSSSTEELKRLCQGLVWKLLQEPEYLEKIAKQRQQDKEDDNATEVVIGDDGMEHVVSTKKSAQDAADRIFQYDMMISYCHADKDIIYKIHEYLLAQGFKIWIDLNNMFGPAMNAMAEAVENSEFVIMCMSDSYKQSTYCQAEAEYAFNCKRRLLPLIVQTDYKPDGWLGFMIGSRIYVDFGRFDFATACEKLLNEISLQRKRPLPSATDKLGPHVKPSDKRSESSATSGTLSDEYTKRIISSNFKAKPLKHWTESDLFDFLFDQRLNELMPLCEKMDGQAIIQLYKMCLSQKNETYNSLNIELNSGQQIKLPVSVYTRFLSIMERITEPPAPPICFSIIEEELPYKLSNQSPDMSYDILVTSPESASRVIEIVNSMMPGTKATNHQFEQHNNPMHQSFNMVQQ
ncbi:unnamed protein product [Rotaria socialis]|nr:unnamed protein product [Rotaria socialis]CAF3331675.1 unnamed protein product [Rotaria socialis]CAF3474175.1 unnamed protein product [Rotaria socialis]